MNEPARFCTACGTALTAGARFCGQCGAPVAAAAEKPAAPASPSVPAAAGDGRRHAFILFADIAGYTNLSQRLDAEDLHDVLSGFFDTVDRLVVDHGGSVDKHIGDAVMAVFGAPVSHDNDALRAATAALAIHDSVAALDNSHGEKLRVRIGIAGGAVVAGETGSDRHREYTVTGEAVNLASRLQGLAPPGETLIDEETESALGAQAKTEPRAVGAIKGFDRPVPVSALIGLQAPSESSTPFVGRAAQLAQLVGALEASRRDGYGQTIVLRGEAGIGKTRLVEELRRRAEAIGYRSVTAHVLDFGAAAGGDAIRQLAQSLLGLGTDTPPAQRQKAIERGQETGLVDETMGGFLHDLLNLPLPPALQPVYDATSPSMRATGRARTVAKLCRRLARRQPLLIVVEDAHWADPAMLTALAHLARRMSECPGLLLMTSRLEGDPFDRAWRAAARDAALLMVDLPPLRKEEATELAAAVAGHPGGVIDTYVARADGNPLFLVQLLKNASATPDELPGTVQSLAQARMDRLDAPARAVLQVAAAAGQRFPIELLRALDPDADRQCDRLVDELFLRRDGDGYMFAHALIRDGVYASLLRARRRELHAAIAGWFATRDPVLYAEHLERADDPNAAEAYRKAAEARMAAMQPEEALVLAERGGKLAATDATRCALALLEGRLRHDLGQGKEALAAYRRALESAQTPRDRCEAMIGVASAHRLLSETLDALAVLETAEPIAATLEDRSFLGRLHHLRGNLNFALGRADACRAAHEKALSIARELGDAVLEARAWSGQGDADYAVGRWDAAAGAFQRCVALAEAQGQIRIVVPNRLMFGHCLIYAAKFAESERQMRQALTALEPLRDAYAELFAHDSLGVMLAIAGQWRAAVPHIERGLAIAEQVGARRYQAALLAQLAECEIEAGRRDKGRELCARARELVDASSFGFVGPSVRAHSAFASDDPAEADAWLREAEAQLKDVLAHNLSWVYRIALETRLRERNWPELEALCERFLAFRPEGGPPNLHALLVKRARAIAAYVQSPDEATAAHMNAVRAEMDRHGFGLPFPG